MISGVTKSGFSFEIDEEKFDDFDTFVALHKVECGNVGYIVDVIDGILTADQQSQLRQHVKTTRGRCTFSGMVEEVQDIFNASKTGKNS